MVIVAKRSGLIFGLLALAVVIIGATVLPGSVFVTDGDTVRVGLAEYRLVGLDTPERGSRAKCAAERKKGDDATSRLRAIVAGGKLTLDRVPCACRPNTEGTPNCNHGRLCAVLRSNGRDVSEIMIAEGLARAYICKGTRCPPRAGWCADMPAAAGK